MSTIICLRPVQATALPGEIKGAGRVPGIATSDGGVRFSDALAWVLAMCEAKLDYHWDDDPHDIERWPVGPGKKTKLFTREEALAVSEIVDLVREAGVDPCAVSVDFGADGPFKIVAEPRS